MHLLCTKVVRLQCLNLNLQNSTDPGLTRDHNEDFLGHVLPSTPAEVQSRGWLFALADGVGGQERGEVASRLAVETVLAGFRKIPKGIMHVSLLPKLVQEANQAVFDQGNADNRRVDPGYSDPGGAILPGGAHMASTLVLCALRFDSAVVSHVGDSRCYLLRQRKLTSLTHDHTMVDEQVRHGHHLQRRRRGAREPAHAHAQPGPRRCLWRPTRSPRICWPAMC